MKIGTLIRPKNVDDLDRVFTNLRENDIDACQLVYKPAVYTQEDAQKIREKAEEYGVEISAQFLGFRDPFVSWDTHYGHVTSGIANPTYRALRMQDLFDGMQFVSWLGLKDFIVHAGYIPNNPFDPEYGAFVAAVRQLCARAKTLGLNFLFETGQESPVTLLRVIKESAADNLFINLDTGNLILYGYGNPVDAMYTFGSYVRGVHAKDALPPTDPYHHGKEVAVGSGFVDFEKVMKMLKENGYDGHLTIEREISGPQQTADILSAKKYLTEVWNRV